MAARNFKLAERLNGSPQGGRHGTSPPALHVETERDIRKCKLITAIKLN